MKAFKKIFLLICSITVLLLFAACQFFVIENTDESDIPSQTTTDSEINSDDGATDTQSESDSSLDSELDGSGNSADNGSDDSVESSSDDNAENSGDDSLDNSSTDSDTSEDDSSLGSGTLVGDGVELPDVALP